MRVGNCSLANLDEFPGNLIWSTEDSFKDQFAHRKFEALILYLL